MSCVNDYERCENEKDVIDMLCLDDATLDVAIARVENDTTYIYTSERDADVARLTYARDAIAAHRAVLCACDEDGIYVERAGDAVAARDCARCGTCVRAFSIESRERQTRDEIQRALELAMNQHIARGIEFTSSPATMNHTAVDIAYRLDACTSQLDDEDAARAIDACLRELFAPDDIAAYERACEEGRAPLAEADTDGWRWIVRESDYAQRPPPRAA